jgi:hypothetical protein
MRVAGMFSKKTRALTFIGLILTLSMFNPSVATAQVSHHYGAKAADSGDRARGAYYFRFCRLEI